jgi:tetratricopeptide (TPR) repeat protein
VLKSGLTKTCTLQIALWTMWLVGAASARSFLLQTAPFGIPAFGAAPKKPSAELNIRPENLTIVMEEPYSLRITDKDGKDVVGAVWMVDDPEIARVESTGRTSVVGLSPGRTTLTATWRGYTAQVAVRVLGSLNARGASKSSVGDASLPERDPDSGRVDPFGQPLPTRFAGDAESHYNRGLVLFAYGSFDGAILEYSEALHLKPRFPEAQTKLAYTLWRVQKFNEAIEAANAALEMNPQNPEAEKTIGLCLAEMKDWLGALQHYARALQYKLDYIDVRHDIAIALWGMGNADQSIYAYREAIRLDPDYHALHFELASKLRSLGRYADAVVEDREAVRLKPDDFASLHNLALSLRDNKEYESSVKYYRLSLAIAPDAFESLFGLSSALYGLGDWQGSAEQATKAIGVGSDSPDAWCNLGAALSKMGQNSAALDAFKQALAIDPDHWRAKGLYDREIQKSGTP